MQIQHPVYYDTKLFFVNQCQTTNEEEIFEVQDKQSLFPLGWIHVSISFPLGYGFLVAMSNKLQLPFYLNM